ncbi:unnamed protein product [Amaranthus hypochondriacus]
MGEEDDITKSSSPSKKKVYRFWEWTIAAILFRILLILFFPNYLSQLASRPELSTPVTSLRRLAEGYWLKKQASISPYAGSMYHGSPLLLSVLGPLTVAKIDGLPSHVLCRSFFCIASTSYWSKASINVLPEFEITCPGKSIRIFRHSRLRGYIISILLVESVNDPYMCRIINISY